MLRDRLVWGVKDTTIQKKLLSETDLTLDKAIQLAQSAETAEKNVKEMGGETPKEPVHQIRGPPGHRKGSGTKRSVMETRDRENCSRCGKPGHQGKDCPFRDRVCHKCQCRGHLARVCRSSSNPKKGPRREKGRRHPVRHLEESEDSTSELEEFLGLVREVGGIHKLYQPPIKVPLRIDGVQVQMELDTGASVSIVSEDQYKQYWPGRSLDKSTIRLQTYSKEPLIVVGNLDVQVEYGSQKVTLPLVVVKDNGPMLFGRNWLRVIKLNWRDIHYVKAPDLQELLRKYSGVFQTGLGTFKGPEVSLKHPHDSARPDPCPMQ